eukprot:6329812-Prymnesium_polylepis.1
MASTRGSGPKRDVFQVSHGRPPPTLAMRHLLTNAPTSPRCAGALDFERHAGQQAPPPLEPPPEPEGAPDAASPAAAKAPPKAALAPPAAPKAAAAPKR